MHTISFAKQLLYFYFNGQKFQNLDLITNNQLFILCSPLFPTALLF